MAGNAGLYVKVHQVFTAANVASGNEFAREKFVYFLDADNSFKADPTLAKCRVFPRLGEILKELKETDHSIGNTAHVQTYVVRNIVAGLPVAANLVTAVFEAIAGKKALNEHEHIFN